MLHIRNHFPVLITDSKLFFQEWKSKADTANGPIEESDGGKCIYICNPNDGKWCRVNYEKPLFSGKTKGLCFTNGACFGTPDACVDCKEKCPKSK